MVSDVPVGVFLSGGYDSSSVAALLQSGMTDRLKTFTIGFLEEEFNEAREARKISEFLGTDHHEWYVEPKDAEAIMSHLPEIYDEPFADNSVIPTVLVSNLARKHVKVALSADGGDEIFAGYAKFNQAVGLAHMFPGPVLSLLSSLMGLVEPSTIPFAGKVYNFSTRYDKVREIWRAKSSSVALKIISQYFTVNEILRLIKEPFDSYSTFFDNDGTWNLFDDDINSLLAVDYKTFLVDNNLVKVDRATMSVGLEGREPMLDHRLIEYLATVPSNIKIKDGVNKWILKEIVHKYIPRELMERPKRPFIAPLGKWFRSELSEMMRYYLSNEALRKSDMFKSIEVQKLLNEYLKGKSISSQKLWNILVYQLWYSRWIEKI
jgi:asparagine synthase (glutamine-hydrolysing)